MTPVSIYGYQISEELYNGSRTLVYRGYREADSLPVVIKLLKNLYPSFSELVQFRNQYTIAKNINSPLIIQTYSLEPYQNSYALVMEDFRGISLKEWCVETQFITSLQEFLQIAIALCNALDILYRHNTIHKDIKPSNILINPETKQIKLIDFSIATLLTRETQTLVSPNILEGTLAYISPEQTGRMNRGIDYRSDFYSLGVTFYELLTGELPFQADDAMELVHCHLAKTPPSVKNKNISQALLNIVMKLMAKNAEDRYQSALGLKYDLEKCLVQLKETGSIEDFPLAQRDVCDRFIIPDKLYGREAEVEILLQAFDRVSQGATEMMLVAGLSGIGKTAVVNEIHKPIVRQRGYFIKGKFDQFNRNIPFSAFVQAFRDLMGQLLTESDTQIEQWKCNILDAVGDNGQVIIDVIPELEQIIGKQPPALQLSGNASQNRFNLLFQKFTQVFTTVTHPLVIFLDDLQWADSASLKLMQLLMADTQHLLLIGAYRDNEVNSAHPFILALSELQKTGVTINSITLESLSQIQINKLVANTLKCPEEIAWNLSTLIFRKTQGNPFFTTQFLKALHHDGLIQFNLELGCWQCDISQITQQAVTDDVVNFMALQLQKLPLSTQYVLQLAACIGDQFDLATLAIVSEQDEVETAACLWKALQEGLILPRDDIYKFYVGQERQTVTSGISQSVTYKFLHDRVQQAAYSLIPNEQKQATHLKLGQLLINNISETEKEEKIFQIVSQLNIGLNLVTQQQERNQLAQLNLLAGRKAKTSTAYTAAVEYLMVGIKMLAIDSWQSQYGLTLALYEEAANAEYLNTNFEQALNLTQIILQQTTQILDRIKAYELIVQIYIAQDEQVKAIETGIKALEQLKISLISLDLSQVNSWYQLPSLEKLVDIPDMSNPESLAGIQLLMSITPAVHHVKPEMFPSVTLTMLNLCQEQGNSSLAAFVYGCYSVLLCAVIKDIDNAYHAGLISLMLLEQHQSQAVSARVYMIFGVFICAYKEHGENTLKFLQDSIQSGLEFGDIEHAAYSMMAECTHLLLIGEDLDTVEKRQAQYINILVELKQKHCLDYAKIWRQVTLNLLGKSFNKCKLTGWDVEEIETLSHLHNTHNHQSLFTIYLAKTITTYTFGNYKLAVINAEQAIEYSDGAFGLLVVAAHNFYYSLSLLAQYSECDRPQQEHYLNQVLANQEIMEFCASHAPMNFQHKYDLVTAETARVMEDMLKAIEYYERAISAAKKNKYLQEEALSNELAAKFYLNWGKEKIAQTYMQEAYYCYARWGAKAKTDDLEKNYPQLLQPILQQRQLNINPLETVTHHSVTNHKNQTSVSSSGSHSSSVTAHLDLAAILKVSQVLSREIDLNSLITSFMRILLHNSGANKIALILPEENIWRVTAIATAEDLETEQPIPLTAIALDSSQEVPSKLIYAVRQTRETLLIDDIAQNVNWVADNYIATYQPKSVLCSPILNQGKLIGILYLENSLVSGAFTSDRLSVINLLSSQAAISLENARLYQQAGQALQDLQQAQLQIVQSEKMSALGNLVAGVAHEMNNPLGFIYSSLKQTQPTIADIVEHLKLYQASLPNPSDEILDHAETIDLDFSLADLPKAIDAMIMACDRLKNISTSLRTFSRADKQYKVLFNIHEGIDSTILILKHRLKANEQRPEIEIVTEYGNLSEIDCFPGQLNQVFMNILANAIDALEEANKERMFEDIQANPNRITITTLLKENQVEITIADNGIGMTEEVKQKIFDHLFTTKAVGKGTGLGLAIARQIVVEKHSGKIAVNSTPGQGTEFVIQLPLSA
ncbi:AAA family ATPase [Nostoc sp. FACHB-152]|uniref:trifunctional serine/threonine-protein kinase/ATP-binding protein/sensor histidine kinase n=1 Tax=unclassified Nostoc TaxID=2593658 RepID=UPI00168313CE|nr:MULTISPECIES: ATP-binding sensor histidine kinase [unclassified Nostoc]MBD2449920.1 AAA family ATPase [Nostoc sp. FACHB-152]MBD2471380.1 AAA family ATPase [Nostoc sp. FACHB-145]